MPTKRVKKCAVKPHKRCPKKSGVVGYRRRCKGGSLFGWIKKKALPWITQNALPWIKQNKLISKGAMALSSMGVPYVGKAGEFAGMMGYGRRRRGRGKFADVADQIPARMAKELPMYPAALRAADYILEKRYRNLLPPKRGRGLNLTGRGGCRGKGLPN